MTRDKASEGCAGPGSPMTPDDLPDEATPADRAKPKAVPIGRPVSREQFEKLKKEAEKRRRPRQGKAQEDPAED
jgi:hypothetical protein